MTKPDKNQELPSFQKLPQGYYVLIELIHCGLLFDHELPVMDELFEYINGKKKYHTPLEVYLKTFNDLTNNNYPVNAELIHQWDEISKHYPLHSVIQALKNIVQVDWYEDRPTALRPITLLKGDKIAQYMNYQPSTVKKNDKPNNNSKEKKKRDYTEVADY